MELAEKRKLQLAKEEKERHHDYFLVYFGTGISPFQNAQSPYDDTLMVLHYTLNTVNYDNRYMVYEANNLINNCYMGQIVQKKPYPVIGTAVRMHEKIVYESTVNDHYYSSEDTKALGDCDSHKLYLINEKKKSLHELAARYRVIDYLRKSLDNSGECPEQLFRSINLTMDFSYLELNDSADNKSLLVARGNGQNGLGLWFGFDEANNYFFTNVPEGEIIKRFCPVVHEFPKSCHARINKKGKITFFDNETGLKSELTKTHFEKTKKSQKKLQHPISTTK